MDHKQELRATSLLLGGITEDVVFDVLAMEADANGKPFDEFQLEDLPVHIKQLNDRIKSQGEVS